MNRQILTLIATATIAVSPLSYADRADHRGEHRRGDRGDFYDYAKVVDVTPLYESVRVSQPQRECWNESIRRPVVYQMHGDTAPGMIVGGIIGGVLGHQVDHGRDAATVAGTLIGATIGHDLARQTVATGEYREETQRHCRVSERHYTEQRLVGYHVAYRYRGEVFTTRMRERPGKFIRIKVDISPANGHHEYY